MTPTLSRIASYVPRTDIPSEPLSRPKRETPSLETADKSRVTGDRELANEYGFAMLRAAKAGTDVRINAIDPHSTFGQWREQLKNTLQLPDVVQWAQDKGIDVSSLILNTQSGQVSFKLKRHLDPQQKLHTVGPEDRQWAAIRGPILHAAQVICAGYPDTAFMPQEVLQDVQIPGSIIARFYQEQPPALTASDLRTQARGILRNSSFKTLDAGTDAGLIESRSEDALLHQQALVGDILIRNQVVFELKELLPLPKDGFERPDDLENQLKRKKLSLPAHNTYPSTYPSADHQPANTISVFDYLRDHGLDIPSNHIELENLISSLSTLPPYSPPNGNLGGALAWPVPLDTQSQQQLKADIGARKFGNINVSPFKNVLEYLLDGRRVTAADLNDPRKLINTLIEAPESKALGEAIQAAFEAREIKGSANDWLLAAMGLEKKTENGDGLTIEGYRLVSAENTNKTASTVVKALADHLLASDRASSPETAAIQAHLLLTSRAPEFLIKDIPKEVTIGTHAWVSFATAVSRIEAKAPGSTAGMTFAQVMLESSIAPISEQERHIEYAAQNDALKDWAIANGRKPPLTPLVMGEVRKTFSAMINELREASETSLGNLPTAKEIALAQLKKALPDMDPRLFEKKCITIDPPHKRFPGPYSILDGYIDGRPLFWTPNREEFWSEEARNFKNLFVSRENEERPDSRPAAWVSSSKEFDLDKVTQTLKTLPRPRELFEPQYAEFSSALKKIKSAQFKQMIAKLPLEDRENLAFIKLPVRKLIRYYRDDHPRVVEEGVLLFDTERNGKKMTYAIDRIKGTVTRRPDQTYVEYPPRNGTIPQLGQRYDTVKPEGSQPPALPDGKTAGHGAPDSFNSASTQYIIDTLFADMNLPEVERYARGATTFDTQVPLHKTIEAIVVGLIPFKSSIENLIAGNIKEGAVELAIDIFGFVVGFGGAVKGLSALARGASTLAKAGQVVRIIGRAALGALNPLDGVADLARGALHLGKKAVNASYKGINHLRNHHRSVDLLQLAKRPDIAEGTYKLAGNGNEIPALAKFDEGTQRWFAFDPRTQQAYGKSLEQFSVGPRGGLDAIGSNDAIKTVSQRHGLAAAGTFKVGQKSVEGNVVMFQGNWHQYDPLKKQPIGPPLKDFTPSRVAASGEVRVADADLLGYQANYIEPRELSSKGLQGNVYQGRSKKEYVKVDGALYESKVKDGQRFILHPTGKGPDIPVKDLGISGWEPRSRSVGLLGGAKEFHTPWQLGDNTYVVPMDGIKVVENAAPPFRINVKGVDHAVDFDSTHGAWRGVSSGLDAPYFWRNPKGAWQQGNINDFLRAKKADAHHYQFVDVSAIPKVPKEVTPLPQSLHYFWAGQDLPAHLADNLAKNSRRAPGYTSVIHVDADTPEIFEKIKTTLKDKAPGVTVKNFREDALYTQLKNDEMYNYFRQGQGKNLAATSDVARYQIMHKHGGVYLDTDDLIQTNVDSGALMAGANDVLLGHPVVHRSTDFKPFYNNSNFATQPGNPLMKEVITEMHKRFAANKPYFVNNRPVARQSINGGAFTSDLDEYGKKLFETTGPTLLNDTLKAKRPDMYDLGLEGFSKDTNVVDGELVSSGPVVNNEERALDLYRERGIKPPLLLRLHISKMREHYFPLRHKFNVKAGADHSWKTG
ncbi:hypothetical protein C4J87_2494 [Pseudomonas sp. R1-43-08]|uniref:glycosyltransferase family 32 protein n=1 Tax=Pseudomonas sp. R1-43-08 TaxID=1173270 RepID=UPI000F56EF28|nr:glycosyltransferase [Pseudomonas sp. R1-43-08]AZF42653.1 hypothetical protein C4J87_2494 [Pseudomonas sp. R1-43-08]